MNQYCFTVANQNSQLNDRTRSRTDIMTISFFIGKLLPFSVTKAMVAVLGCDSFDIKKLGNRDILVEVDKETQSSKLMKMTKLSLSMDNVIPIIVSPHYYLKSLKAGGVIKLDRILVFTDGKRKLTMTFILTIQSQTLAKYVRVGYYRVAVLQFS